MPARKRMTEELADRLAFTAEMMVRLRSSRRVEVEVSKRFGVDPRTVRAWMKRVRELRREEMGAVDRIMARDDMRESLNTAAALAIGRMHVVKDKDGNPIMEDFIDPATGQVLKRVAMRANPDLQRFLHACRELVHLDGLAEEAPSAPIKVEVEATKLPDLAKLPPATARKAADALARYVQAVAPNGDASAIAGDWFKLAGDEPVTTIETPAPKTDPSPSPPLTEPEGA
jgi:hypothetical protein